jgi:hypothetical protein
LPWKNVIKGIAKGNYPQINYDVDSDREMKDLNLKQVDKDIIMANEGMLNDRIIHAAHQLLRMQFPKFEGGYSTLLVQRQCFPLVTSDRCSGMSMTKTTIQTHSALQSDRCSGMSMTNTTIQVFFPFSLANILC